MSLPAQSQSLAPAQVFICRHGARLDASDSTWHLTSPTPYDPPLTYGGWTQARTLGTRIATHIVSQISSEYPLAGAPAPKPAEKGSTWSAGPKEAKKEAPLPSIPSISTSAASKLGNTRVIIHTSPFLRCVQTSIAVTAGMSQYFSDINVKAVTPDGSSSGSSSGGNSTEGASKLVVHPRPMLRVDGFLSEWLCEDYFTDITPPPATDLMVGTAKIDLMRPSSAGGLRKDGTTIAPTKPSQTHISPPHHHSHHRAHSVGFVPPVATSAIGKNEPIPRGHVSHAKEFIDIDYSYDSLRYGDGGEYGEEWGRMHKRVKIGFEKIIKDYADGEVKPCLKNSSANSFEQLVAAAAAARAAQEEDPKGEPSNSKGVEKPKDVPGSTIIIFISHGAICNALIGAMTHKPVLMDMGIASMSMGVLIPSSTAPPALPAPSQPKTTEIAPTFQLPGFGGIEDLTDSEDPISLPSSNLYTPYTAPPPQDTSAASGIPQYDVKITASTDHLRPPAASQSKPQAQGSKSGPSAVSSTPPLRPRKPSVGGSGFSMYNSAGKLPAPLIGSAGSSGAGNSGGGISQAGGGTGLFTGGRAMGMVFGAANSSGASLGVGSGGSGHAIGVRRTASAAAATKGLWSLPPAAEMERGSSDEGAVLTDEESGEEKKDDEETGKSKKDGTGSAGGSSTSSKFERKGSTAGVSSGGMRVGGMGGGSSKPGGGKPGLWGSGGNANTDRRRRWTVTNQNDEAGA
ncbi:hypothetical protein TWF718_007839 [Orbilia javanica]|uniref:Uncharacterized protein n=1 Tax=Orbilia javanica TaxID=47235 RepID=A0AAN8MV86_9PEZI